MVESESLDPVFHALADATRRGMLRELVRGERTVSQLAEPFPMSLAAASKHVKVLERWLQSYRPGELFDDTGRLVPDLSALAPIGDRRMGSNPHANGGARADGDVN